MWRRAAWQERIEQAWRRKNVVWLMGVRRTGKTVLGRSLPAVEYLDCELPSVRRQLADPERFLAGVAGKRVVLDEIHRLDAPAELLKIAADHAPATRILATGSSTLGASARFRDTLAGRKEEVWLTPMTLQDVRAARGDVQRRLHHGGLPPFFAADPPPERDYQEWLDAYWAKDVLELFRLERRRSFQRLLELLFAQSGGLFEASSFASPCEVSRTTVSNYVAVLEATFVVHQIRPFSSNPAREITAAPKVYAFDAGFVRAMRGWREVRPEDEGALWEHFVLDELHAHLQRRSVQYWRTKQGDEVDFVLARRGAPPIAIECKRNADTFDPRSLIAFRSQYAGGHNFVVAMDVKAAYERSYGAEVVRFVGLRDLIEGIAAVEERRAPQRRRKPGRR